MHLHPLAWVVLLLSFAESGWLAYDGARALMKSVHLVIGVVWLAVMACYVLGCPWAWAGMLACAFAGIWYVPFGTLLSIIQISLLLMPAIRSAT